MAETADLQAFDPQALWVARSFRGLSISELAERSGVSRQVVNSIESGKRQPFRPALLAIADALHFPARFFLRAPIVPSHDAIHFRKGAKVPERAIDRAVAIACVFGRIAETFGSFASFAPVRLPSLGAPKDVDGVERAADAFRTAIGVGLDAPIAHAVRAAEASGVFVGTLDPAEVPIHGFASVKPLPLVMLSEKSGWSRRRFSVMHEIGHLVMHGHHVPEDKETQADRFAGAALVPRAAFWREFRRPSAHEFDWGAMLAMKRRWGISLQAIVHRAYDLALIDAAQYRTANIHISKYGWRTNEPGEEVPEMPGVCARFVSELKIRAVLSELCVASDLYAEIIGQAIGVKVDDEVEQSEIIPMRRPRPSNDQVENSE
jgi:Zn-dependent peptidase ImmA (M78 family)/transcriptional regulator with XRE-family HTH domain